MADYAIQPVVDRVLDPELPRLIEAIYGIPAPPTPRLDIAEIFLTGVTTQLDGLPLMDDTSYEAPIQLDLNSQAMNADVNPALFRPSEMIRLNMSIPHNPNPDRLGVLAGDLQCFPNGRRLVDDVVDIEIQALEGFFLDQDGDGEPDGIIEALATGDSVNENDVPFTDAFPHLALPHNDAVNQGPDGPAALSSGDSGAGLFGTSVPALPVATGLASLVLLGAGGMLLARNRRTLGAATPAV